MRGYSKMSDEERQQIAKLHANPYDGYAVGNVQSNMTPLTVYDARNDKNGVTVTNKGEVINYKNHNINETAAKNLHYDEIDEPYEFKSGDPVDPFREEYDEDSEYDELEETDFEGEIEDDKIDGLTENVNKTLEMFKRFKNFN